MILTVIQSSFKGRKVKASFNELSKTISSER